MRYQKTHSDDIPELTRLWKQAFGDTDAEIDSFFKTVYPEATGFCAEEDGAVIAMLFALPLTLAHSEEMQKAIDMLSEVKESIINVLSRQTRRSAGAACAAH